MPEGALGFFAQDSGKGKMVLATWRQTFWSSVTITVGRRLSVEPQIPFPTACLEPGLQSISYRTEWVFSQGVCTDKDPSHR